MPRFRIRINGTFDALDQEAALKQLAEHLTKLSHGVLPPDLFDPGMEFHIAPEERIERWRKTMGHAPGGVDGSGNGP